MAKGKYRITFTNSVPNDQGGVIPNNVIDYSRYDLNPVVLREHQWGDYAVALMSDIDKGNENHSGVPDFNSVTNDSKICEQLYNMGHLRSASIGGEATWKKDKLGNYELDADGNRICTKFLLYEISLPTLPSNPTAVSQMSEEEVKTEINKAYSTLKSKIYNDQEIPEIIKLCSKYSQMSEKKNKETLLLEAKAKKEEAANLEAEALKLDEKPANLHVEEDKSSHVILQAMEKRDESLFSFLKTLFSKSAPLPIQNEEGGTDPAISKNPGKVLVDDKIGQETLKAKKEAEEKAEKARANYEAALEKATKAKKEADDETEEEEKAKKMAAYNECVKECEAAKKEAESAKDEIEKQKEEKEKTKESAKLAAKVIDMKPEKKTFEELAGEYAKLAANPDPKENIKFSAKANVPTFTQLCHRDNKEGKELLQRVQAKDGSKDLREYAVVLNSIIEDPKYKGLVDMARFHLCNSDQHVISLRDNPGSRPTGYSLKDIAARLNSGYVEGVNFNAGARAERMTKLSTDGSLGSLDAIAVEWLPLVIQRMVPSDSFLGNIPMIAANETVRNTSVVWINTTSRPNIYRGTQPANTVNSYGPVLDAAVYIKMVPYWMDTMLWMPETMHMLRYDPMGTQWAQALADLEAYMSDDKLYTLLAGLIANQPANMVYTNGPLITSQGGNTPTTFQIPTTSSPDAFILNPSFVTGSNQSLTRPGLNDIISGQQILSKQNYDLSNRKVSLVVDSTMYKYLMQDPETKSNLTKFVTDDGKDLTGFSHTTLYERSRVALYDPNTAATIDTHLSGVVIPPTAISAGVGFVANDVAIAIGMFDVFAVQSPTDYAYKLSANIRTGIRALRADYTGVWGYTYNRNGF